MKMKALESFLSLCLCLTITLPSPISARITYSLPKTALDANHAEIAENSLLTRGGRGGGYRGGYRGGSRGTYKGGRSSGRSTRPSRPPAVTPPRIRPPVARTTPKLSPRITPRSNRNLANFAQKQRGFSKNLSRASRTGARQLGKLGLRSKPTGIKSRPGSQRKSSRKNPGISKHASRSTKFASKKNQLNGLGKKQLTSKVVQKTQGIKQKGVRNFKKPANDNKPKYGSRAQSRRKNSRSSERPFRLLVTGKHFLVGRSSHGVIARFDKKGTARLRGNPKVAHAERKLAQKTFYPKKNGFSGKPKLQTMKPGTVFDRLHTAPQIINRKEKLINKGKYASPIGTPFKKRALAGTKEQYNSNQKYMILKPIKAWTGKAAPGFTQPGGGTQYKFRVSLEKLIKNGYIKEIP